MWSMVISTTDWWQCFHCMYLDRLKGYFMSSYLLLTTLCWWYRDLLSPSNDARDRLSPSNDAGET